MQFPRLAYLACVIVASALVAGCATPARTDQMVVSATAVAGRPVPAALKDNVAIKDVTGGRETNPMWLSSVGSAEFEGALEQSLKAAGMLSANRQAGRWFLTTHLEKLEQPWAGFDLTVTAHVNYVLSERATGKDVFNKSLVTPFTATMSDAFVAVERLKLANEGAIRASITQLIDELSRLQLDAPAGK